MESNILKLAFLMAYLAMLICVVSGIPFMTSLFRSILLLVLFGLAGFGLRWYLLKVVTGIELEKPAGFGETESYDETFGAEESEQQETDYNLENVEQNQPGS